MVSKHPKALPPHLRLNFAAFLAEFVSFDMAFMLINPTSVLPAFVRQWTDSALLVGLVSTVWKGGETLPQLASARLIGDRPRKKPYLYVALAGRVALWGIPLALWAGLTREPKAMLILLFICLGLFAITEGFSEVPWLDIMARALPLKWRGRLIGTGQITSGLAGIGAGALIGVILERFAFPDSYTLLFSLACAAFTFSTVSLFLLREPPPENVHRTGKRQTAGGWFRPLVADPAFRHLMICRVLFGMLGISTSFYIVHAADVLHLPDRVIGSFVIAQTLSGVAFSVGLSLVSERWGPRRVIWVGIAGSMTGPLFALIAHLVRSDWLVQAYPFVFVALGVISSTYHLGFTNSILELAPSEDRATYVGLGNTIGGALALAPAFGGWLLEATSYTVLFSLTTVVVAAGFLISLGLKPIAAPADARVPAHPAIQASPKDSP